LGFIAGTTSFCQTIGVGKLLFVVFLKRKNWNAAFCDPITGQVSTHPFWEFMHCNSTSQHRTM